MPRPSMWSCLVSGSGTVGHGEGRGCHPPFQSFLLLSQETNDDDHTHLLGWMYCNNVCVQILLCTDIVMATQKAMM